MKVAISNNLKEQNKIYSVKKVLNHIRCNMPIARVDIGKDLCMTKPTVTRVLTELIDKGLVVETSVERKTSVRPKINLGINEDAYYSVAVFINRYFIKTSLVDLKMNCKYTVSVPISELDSEDDYLREIELSIDRVLKNSGVSRQKIHGIGIAAPGPVDYENGVLIGGNKFLKTKTVLFENIYCKEYLEKAFGITTYIENDGNVMALSEYWSGYGQGYNNVLTISCDDGIGSGIVYAGKIIRGKKSLNVGMGHTKIDVNGEQCMCGGYGCIETFATVDSIISYIAKRLEQGQKSIITSMSSIGIKTIAECECLKDELCMSALNRASRALGIGIANISSIFNPEIVILKGPIFEYSSSFFYNTIKYAKESCPNNILQEISFKIRKMDDEIHNSSASCLVFNNLFI